MQQTQNEIEAFENGCKRLLNEDANIRFAGIINKMGRLVAGGFRAGTKSFIGDEQKRILYQQMTLELSMRKDFDDTLGPIKWIASRRGNLMMISIPLNSHLLLISSEPKAKVSEISNISRKIFKDFLN